MNGAVITLARWHARQVIKRQLYAQGIKLAHVESREITIAANKYIDDHPESIAFATEQYRSLVASGRLRPPRKLKLCSTICTATEALSCKGFRCANIVNEMKRKAMRGPNSLCMMEVKQ
ncbi:MAG: hypothetical protein WA704_02145 [Pseudolabrys sp.]